MQYVPFLWNFSQITSNHQQILTIIFRNMILFKYQIYQVPWNSMEFHGTSKQFYGIPWNSMELFQGKLKVPWNSMELGSMETVPWNSMKLWIWTKFHGIPCGTWDFVAWVPWNSMAPQMLFKCSSKSSMELWMKSHGLFFFLSKWVSMTVERYFEWNFDT